MTLTSDLPRRHGGLRLDPQLAYFPVTPFAGPDTVDLDMLATHIGHCLGFGPGAVFAACGTGEFSSLGLDEYEAVVSVAVQSTGGAVPVFSGVGYNRQLALEFVRRAERVGVDGLLVFPPASTPMDQHSLVHHYKSVAAATDLPLIVYQRDAVRLSPSTARELAEVPNIVGLKDGQGNLENLVRIQAAVGNGWSYVNGLPTAELSQAAFSGVGISAYSSAVFAFFPELAMSFYRATVNQDQAQIAALLDRFYVPFAELRDRRPGYAISLIKAGLRLRGNAVGRVRAPLGDPTAEEETELARLIEEGWRVLEESPAA